jgi:uncharacterized Zn finger protein (UPF0148 family)
MISKYDLKKYFKEYGEEIGIVYNEADDSLYKNGDLVCSLDKYLEAYRLETGQSFTSVYNCRGTLLNVLRCDKCGTVIFSSDNYEEYDDALKCPTCTDYKTYFTFWTKEEIESDEKKKKEIEMYEEWTRLDVERYHREKKRGKTDREITKHTIRTKMYKVDFVLGCDDISRSYFRGLRYEIGIWKKDSEDSLMCTQIKHINIPLSWSQLYYRFIYKHLGKCHPDLRSKWYIGKAREVN